MNRLIAALMLLPFLLVSSCASSGTSDQKAEPPKPSSAQAQKKTRVDPLYSITLMRQGNVLMQQGHLEEAIEYFEQANRVAPGNATVHNMIGLCHLRMGQFDQALASFNKTLVLVPDFTDARNNRGSTYMAMGQFHMAEVDFLAVLSNSTYPHRKQVYFNLGLTYLQRGQLGAAAEYIRKSIILPNPVFDGYLVLAKLAQRQGETDLAKSLLEEARLEFPERVEVSFELGKLLMLTGQESEARPHLERVIASDPTSESADTARALLGQDE
ncbi:MAG: tetratricopeptide repeat protein [Acidobacteria bacterium]|nr:tetratricopeptide repeat protein [Acidobacteriota bacterium]